jgi:hypothetical protein
MAEHARDYEETARAVVDSIWSSFWSEGRGINRALTLAIKEHGEHPEIIRLVRDLGGQNKVPQGIDVGMELIAALWLARQGILASSPVGDDTTSPIIDLGAEWAGKRWGVEVKSNRDAVQNPLLYGGSGEIQGWIDLCESLWPGAGASFVWEETPPANDLSHTGWKELKSVVAARIRAEKDVRPTIEENERLVVSWSGELGLQGDEETTSWVSFRLEILGRGAGMSVSFHTHGADSERAFRRITKHAMAKSTKLSKKGIALSEGIMMYVSCDSYDDVSPTRVAAQWPYVQGAIDPMWKGIAVLRVLPKDEDTLKFLCHATDYQGEAWGGADVLPDPSGFLSARRAWNRMQRAMARGIAHLEREGRVGSLYDEVVRVQTAFLEATSDHPEAQKLWVRALCALSNANTSVQGLGRVPYEAFPCPDDSVILLES